MGLSQLSLRAFDVRRHGAQMRARLIPALLTAALLCAGCGGASSQPPDRELTPPWAATQPQQSATRPATAGQENPDRLYGTWVAQNVQAPMGQVDIRLSFQEQGPVRILAWSELPLVGQVRSKTAPYKIQDHTLVSEAIRGGTSVKYWFTPQGQLVIQYQDGQRIVFERKE